MNRKYKLLKDQPVDGDKTIPAGTIMYNYVGATYGCCAQWENPMTLNENQESPFIGVNRLHLQLIED